MLHRDFVYPLNVLMHVLMLEEGSVDALHYGIFEAPGERIGLAQARSTHLLMTRLPAPPARILDVGIGLGATLHELATRGYDAHGITPEPSQLALANQAYGGGLPALCARFEDLGQEASPFDVMIFQESAQYIDAARLFAVARTLAPRLLVLDEFALTTVAAPSTLHSRDAFLAAAAAAGFRIDEELDLSRQAAPTVDYFLARLPRRRDELRRDLDVTTEQVDELIASGLRYRDNYATGAYGYRLMDLQCTR